MPKSIFIQETQPSLTQLIEQGMRLWHEEAALRPGRNLEKLWLIACEYMDKDLHRRRSVAFQRYLEENKDNLPGVTWVSAKSSEMISATAAKLLIVGGSLVPKTWNSLEPYPYQGLFVSAFYFLEAKNQLEETNVEASWVSLTQAYYYLGMNSSTLTAHESAFDASKGKHANNSKALRKVVVTMLTEMRADTSIESKAHAIRRVVSEISKNPDHMAVLNDFDSKSSEETKKPKSPNTTPKTPLARLYDRLEEWSAPKGRHPDVVEAFVPFKRGHRPAASKKDKSSSNAQRPKIG